MTLLESMQSISKYLARFSEQIKILNGNKEFSINTHAENLLVNILNIVYDLNLENLNQSVSGNYASIDLLDLSSAEKNSFQITSTNTLDKVKDCIQKFFRNKIYLETKNLNLYILTTKQDSYSEEAIRKKINQELQILLENGEIKNQNEIDFHFDPKKNILDKTDLYKKLNNDNNIDKIIKLETYLKKQFGLIEERDELIDYYQKLKNLYYDSVMDDENGMTLDQIYTEPSFSIIHSAFKNDDPRFINQHKEKFYSVDSRYKIHEFVDEILKGENPLSLSKHHRLILILGYPGQGKSSYCKKVLNQYILEGNVDNKPVFYFQLRNIRQVREFIYNPITVLLEEASFTTEQNLDKFEFNKAFLILDGLDELYMRDNLKLEEIDRVCIELVRLIEKFPELQIILTSRYGYIDDEKLTKENILILQLAPFTLNLQLEWLSKYQLFHPETHLSGDRLSDLNTQHHLVHIRELVGQPLLLHMIASLNTPLDETTNRAKIYKQLFSELIERKYSRDGQLEILKNISKDNLRDLIREIAFSIFQNGNEYITKFELVKLPATQSFLKLLPEANFRDSIKGIMISFYFKEIKKVGLKEGIDEDKSNYAIEFLHKSLREYMTAEKMFYTIKELFLDKRMSGKYVIDDAVTGLKLINDIFGKQDLSQEIRYHLNEIINNATDFDKEELVDRMCLFLDDFVAVDFVQEYRMEHNKNCINISLRSFYGFWYFISCLRLKKNYLINPITREQICKYLIFISTAEVNDIVLFDFSHQDFQDQTFNGVNFFQCLFINTNFSQSAFTNIRFNNCRITDTNFKDSYSEQLSINHSIVTNCCFYDSYIDNLYLSNSIFENNDLTLSIITNINIAEYQLQENDTENKMIISECNFTNSRIDKKSIETINGWFPDLSNQDFTEFNETQEEVNEVEHVPISKEIHQNYKRIITTSIF